jgi:hypothetical protein
MNDHDIDKIIREIVFEMEDEGGKKKWKTRAARRHTPVLFPQVKAGFHLAACSMMWGRKEAAIN